MLHALDLDLTLELRQAVDAEVAEVAEARETVLGVRGVRATRVTVVAYATDARAFDRRQLELAYRLERR